MFKLKTGSTLVQPIGICCNLSKNLAASVQFCCSASTGQMRHYTVLLKSMS